MFGGAIYDPPTHLANLFRFHSAQLPTRGPFEIPRCYKPQAASPHLQQTAATGWSASPHYATEAAAKKKNKHRRRRAVAAAAADPWPQLLTPEEHERAKLNRLARHTRNSAIQWGRDALQTAPPSECLCPPNPSSSPLLPLLRIETDIAFRPGHGDDQAGNKHTKKSSRKGIPHE